MRKKTPQHKYTQEDIDFIKDNIDTMSYKKMAICFEEKHGRIFTSTQLAKYASTHGIKKQIRVYQNGGRERSINLSDEQVNFVIENAQKCNSYGELSDRFFERYGIKIGKHVLNRIAVKKGIHVGRRGCWDSKNHPTKQKIGTEKIGAGYKMVVKVSDIPCEGGGSKSNKTNWRYKHRYVYEQYHGCIPKDGYIIFLNGNQTDFSEENLYCINKSINTLMVQNSWFSSDRNITLAAIRWCELYYAMRNGGKIEFNGQLHTLNEWSKITGISPQALRARIEMKWSIRDVFETPIRGTKKKKR